MGKFGDSGGRGRWAVEVERSPAAADDDRRLNCEHVDVHQHDYILLI